MKAILVGMIGGMGDLVACEPVARHLRKIHPDAELTWVGNADYIELLRGHPALDRLLGVRRLDEWVRIRSDSAYDSVIDLHPDGWTQMAYRLALRKGMGNPCVTADNYYHFGPLLSAFCVGAGLPPLQDAPQLFLDDEAAAGAGAAGFAQDYAVVHCRSSDPGRDWPAAKWRQLVEWLTATLGLKVLEVGSVPSLAVAGGGDVEFRAMSARQLAHAIRRAVVFIGIDSGPAHLANALRVPAVVIAGRYKAFERYFPYTGEHARSPRFQYLFNAHGPAAGVALEDVAEAVRRVAAREPRAAHGADQAERAGAEPRTYAAWHPDSQTDFGLHPEFPALLPSFIRHNEANNACDLARLWSFILNCKQVIAEGIAGDFAELGVWRGNTAAALALFAARSGRELHLFDTYSGFDARDLSGPDRHRAQGFADTSLDMARSAMGEFAPACHFVSGYFPESIGAEHDKLRFAAVSLDCDLYAPMKAGLEYFYPRMSRGGIFFLHDYSSGHWQGARQAIDEFCRAQGEYVVLLPDKSGSALFRKYRETN